MQEQELSDFIAKTNASVVGIDRNVFSLDMRVSLLKLGVSTHLYNDLYEDVNCKEVVSNLCEMMIRIQQSISMLKNDLGEAEFNALSTYIMREKIEELLGAGSATSAVKQ